MKTLFFSRLVLYILAFALPAIHPAIAVSYDVSGWLLWFFLVPAEMVIAFFFAPPKMRFSAWLLVAVAPVIVVLAVASGFDSSVLLIIGGAIASFVLTAFIFKVGARLRGLFVLEQFALGYIYYQILSFSRSSETAAADSAGLTQAILMLLVVAFLAHSLILYLSTHRRHESHDRRLWKEAGLFAGVAVPLILVFSVLLPPDFVEHQIVENLLNNEAQPQPIPVDETGNGLEQGNLQSENPMDGLFPPGFSSDPQDAQGGGQQPGESEDQAGGESQLQGIPADQWVTQQGSGQGDQGQRAVMVVAADRESVYAADEYFGRFDSVGGFVPTPEEPLNRLTNLRLVDTWSERPIFQDRAREPFDVYFFSSIPDRVVAYHPIQIEPTILDRRFHPFNYSYHVVSEINTVPYREWGNVRGLSESEREQFAPYLELDMPAEYEASFREFYEENVAPAEGYFDRVDAILRSFSTYQYELGFDDDVSVAKMERFLTTIQSGDCTEFSNTAAILGRMAGIPTRVVTGWLASRGLQTQAHMQGLMMLREQMAPLQEFPLSELFLVTTSHRHSWVQFYMPGYGWVDFETTAFAIPPEPGQNPNQMRVVIPLLEDQTELYPERQFPWLAVAQILLFSAVTIVVGLYLFRYGRELYLRRVSKGSGPKAARALYLLLLMKLAAAGYEVKRPSLTPMEYSHEYPETREFASRYTRLKYRTAATEGEQDELLRDLSGRYGEVVKRSRRGGLGGLLKRTFSLKGLYYR